MQKVLVSVVVTGYNQEFQFMVPALAREAIGEIVERLSGEGVKCDHCMVLVDGVPFKNCVPGIILKGNERLSFVRFVPGG